MKIRSMFHVLTVIIVLLTFNNASAFGRGPCPPKSGVNQNKRAKAKNAILMIGDQAGVDDSDAQRAALLVAKELRKQGFRVGILVHETPDSGTVYRVGLRRSDENEKFLLRLSEETTDGTIIVEREMLLTDIEEVDSAVQRLVYALVHRKPITSDTTVVGVGLFRSTVPIKEILPAGVGIGWNIDKLSFTVDLEGRVAYGETGYQSTDRKYDLLLWSVSMGGRYFFIKQNISPYIGGGFAAMFAKYTTTVRSEGGFFIHFFGDGWNYDRHPEDASGAGAYGVLGIEFLRPSIGRLKFEIRVDRPFFKLSNFDVMPITLGIAGGLVF